MVLQDSFNTISLFGVDLDQWPGCIGNKQVLNVLSEEEIKRADRYQLEHLRERFLGGRYFLRQVLGRLTGTEASEVRFEIGPNGKPFLKSAQATGGHFSFSRSGPFAVCCFAAEERVGIDIESLKEIEEMPTVAESIFSDDRYAQWASLPTHEKQNAFYRSWTRKEAAAKIDGRGISADLTCIDVPLECLGRSETAQMRLSNVKLRRKQMPPVSAVLSDWHPFHGTTACVAFEADLPAGHKVEFRDQADGEKDCGESNLLGLGSPIVFTHRQFLLVKILT